MGDADVSIDPNVQDVNMNNQITGGPPPPPAPGGYAEMIQGPNATAQSLAAEGVEPQPPPPPPMAQLYASYQLPPHPPLPPSGSVAALADPVTQAH